MKRTLSLLALLALFAGCTPKEGATTDGTAKQKTPAAVATGEQTDNPTKTGNETTGTGSEAAGETASLPLDSLPASLKHDGFRYYGLGNQEPMEIEVTSTPNGEVLTGTQTTKLISMDGEKAVFRVERTGGLERLGTNEYTLDPKGIYVKSSTVAKTKGNELEIPASLTIGKKWNDTTELEMNGQALKMSNTYKVVGVQKVKTKKGTFDALLITTAGKGVVDGKNVRMDSKSWYTKDIGNVKTDITMTSAGGEKRTISYQVTG